MPDPFDPIRGGVETWIPDFKNWYVVRTTPRMGDRALMALHDAGFEFYVPRTTRIAVRRGQRVVRNTQLLLRTVFIGVRHDGELEFVRSRPGVAEILSRPELDIESQGNIAGLVNRPVRLDPVELQRFVSAVVDDEIVQPFGVRVGQGVIVRDGPFASFPGIIEEILPGERFKVALALFGRVSPIELGIAQFEAVT